MTNRYAAGGQTDPFPLNLKCLTHQTTIKRVQRETNSTDDGTQKIDDNLESMDMDALGSFLEVRSYFFSPWILKERMLAQLV